MTCDLLYTTGNPNTEPSSGANNLLHNLSDYDYIQIFCTTHGDSSNYYTSNGGAHPFQVLPSDVINSPIKTYLYMNRYIILSFTDTTFTQIASGAASESSSYVPYVYKIYGIKC